MELLIGGRIWHPCVVARERHRRSLLKNGSTPTPKPRQRVMRTPQSLRVVGHEEAPPAPRLLKTPAPVMRVEVSRVPPDPSMVEFDLTESEFPELSDDSFDAIEALDDFEELDELEELDALDEPNVPSPPAAEVVPLPVAPGDPWASETPMTRKPVTAAPPSHRPGLNPAPMVASAPSLPPSLASAPPTASILDLPLPPSPVVLLARMGVAFVAALLVTMGLILLPWFLLIAPQVDAARQARRAATPAVAAVVPVPPVPAEQPAAPSSPAPSSPAPVVPVPVAVPGPELGPSTPPPDDAEDNAEVPAPTTPDPVAAVRPEPRPAVSKPRRPTKRPVPRRPEPEVAPAVVAPVVITPNPVAPKPTQKAPPALAPVKARALAGRMGGSAGSEDLSMTVRMLAEGRIAATILRGGVRRSASGTYTLDGNDATFVLVESGGTGTYSGKLSASGASGRFTTADGDRERFKARR